MCIRDRDKDVARAKLALWYNEIEEFGYDTFTTVDNHFDDFVID